jgi:hypothetical protein
MILGYLDINLLIKCVRCATPSRGIELYIDILMPGLKVCARICTIPASAASLINNSSRAVLPPHILKMTLILLLNYESEILVWKYPLDCSIASHIKRDLWFASWM